MSDNKLKEFFSDDALKTANELLEIINDKDVLVKIIEINKQHCDEPDWFYWDTVKDKILDKNKEDEMIKFFKPFLTNLTIKNNFERAQVDYYDLSKNNIFTLTKDGFLYVTYRKIWSVFEKEFGLSFYETQMFINNMVREYLFLKDIRSVGVELY